MTTQTKSVTNRYSGLVIVVAGFGLGLLAMLTDLSDGLTKTVLLALTDKGFLWALAAVLSGSAAATVRRGAFQGSLALATATTTYYGLVILMTDRWRGGVPVDGSNGLLYGLQSVGRAAAFWLAASVTIGGLLGSIGFWMRRSSHPLADLLAGIAGGALASGGVYSLVSWSYPIEAFWWVNPVVGAFTVVVSIAGPIVVMARRDAHSWSAGLAGFVIALVVCLCIWYGVSVVRNSYL
jgi:hypothetical protein